MGDFTYGTRPYQVGLNVLAVTKNPTFRHSLRAYVKDRRESDDNSQPDDMKT